MLTAAEQHLVKSLSAEKGRDLLKEVRTHLIETARPVMEAMVQGITGVKVVTLHHDVSTTTGQGGRALYPGQVADSSRREEKIAVLSRHVKRGSGAAKASASPWRTRYLICPSMKDVFAFIYPYGRDKYL